MMRICIWHLLFWVFWRCSFSFVLMLVVSSLAVAVVVALLAVFSQFDQTLLALEYKSMEVVF